MKQFTDLQRRQIARSLAEHRYELSDDGRIILPEHKLAFGGVFTVDINGGDISIAPNKVVTEGLVDVLKVYFQSSAQRTAFYMAPFSANAAPGAGLTAATFASTQTEVTAYSQSTRVPWTPPGAAITAASIDNTAAPSVFSFTALSTVWGFGLLTASAKSATTGILVAAGMFTTAKAPDNGDTINATYAFAASST